ncbi:MAG: DUF1572 domain-containing protein [Gemmatimonadota bacterium]|nr:DUF1572 domain-containing protein [Gemmatimonadota bacterium]MDH3421544.1 DUF1572 domain-containing protein [Gemmatimonadota bacterium]
MSSPRHAIASIEGEYRRYRSLGEGVIDQLSQEELVVHGSSESLSIATLVWHISGNLESRFTDFLTADGEKPWRHRETEFEDRQVSRDALIDKWDRGWAVLFEALDPLVDEDLARSITIRDVPLTIAEALHRSLAHASYHVGQMAYIGKMLRGEEWHYLSIPPGGSAAYNANPTLEKGLGGAR